MSNGMVDFKSRFIAALPSVPSEINLRLDEFIEFKNMTQSHLTQEDSNLLTEQGLPRQASPFLSFTAFSQSEIQQLTEALALPCGHFPIGQNGYGDLIAIDTSSREIVYFNHDAYHRKTFINSTLQQFVECLCIYQEHLTVGNMTACLAAMELIDSHAVTVGCMWHTEVCSEIENR